MWVSLITDQCRSLVIWVRLGFFEPVDGTRANSVGGQFLDDQDLPKLRVSLRHFPSLHQKKTLFIDSMAEAIHPGDKSASRLRRTVQNGKKTSVEVELPGPHSPSGRDLTRSRQSGFFCA
jgi:hypothetical protein